MNVNTVVAINVFIKNRNDGREHINQIELNAEMLLPGIVMLDIVMAPALLPGTRRCMLNYARNQFTQIFSKPG